MKPTFEIPISQQLPPGLENEDLELYAHGLELKALYNGEKIDFWKLPNGILDIFRKELFSKKNVVEAMVTMDITDEDEMLYQYCFCNYGGWNRNPDLKVSGELNTEYWDCGNRGKCKVEGKLCIKLNKEEKNPTRQELEIIKLIALGLADKEIADKLNIHYTTVTTHRAHIEKKLGAASKVDVATFALKNNLPSSNFVKAPAEIVR
jgi:DNA-binding CsgD family transcriptional regulator